MATHEKYEWHLHDGTEGVYQDPMGRRTPLRVLRVHNKMATVEWMSGATGRVSCRRITGPTYAEAAQHFPKIAEQMAEHAKFGIIHNGMPEFFKAIAKAVGH